MPVAFLGLDRMGTVQAATQPLMAPAQAQDSGLLKHLLVLDAPCADDHYHQHPRPYSQGS